MKRPAIPPNETHRLKALESYQILDSLPEQEYDDITKIASQICGTPIALISLIDKDRQWFKSNHGLDAKETPRELAYCAHAINKPDKILEVPDALKDDRFHDNPLAVGEPHVRFYAGAPLTDGDGFTLGTLCVIDHEERLLTKDQKDTLWALSRQVVSLLQLRKEIRMRSQTDQNFNELVENLGDGVFELDEKGNCTYANSKMLQMLQRSSTEVLNTSIWDMIYEEDVDKMKRFYGGQFKKLSKKCYYEYRLQPKNADPIWISQSTTMAYEGKKMVRLRSISRDITETKALEKELALKESLYKLVSENSSDLIALHELDGTYKYVSPSAVDILGYTSEELIGRNPYEFIHPDDIEQLKNGAHQQALNGKAVSKIERRAKRKDGTWVWLESYANPIIDKEGNVVSFQSSARDISEKKNEEFKISKHLDGLTLLNELASLPARDEDVLNNAIQKVTLHLGMDIGIIGQIRDDFYVVKHYFSKNDEIDDLKKYPVANTYSQTTYDQEGIILLTDKKVTHQDHPCFRKSTFTSYVGSCIFKNREKYGTVDLISYQQNEKVSTYDKEFLQLFANWVGYILEAQEEKEQLEKAKKHAEAASEAKDSFLSMMSHEIRTPLNGIIGTTHLLLSKSPSKVQVPHLKVLEQSSNNLMAIVNDILDFNKIEEGKIQIDKTAFDLSELVNSIFKNYKTQGNEKGLEVILNYDQTLSNFYIGDSVRISQILHNLLNNAVKFTHEGQVSLDLKLTNQHDNFDEVEFLIKDSGVGIPKNKLDEIFDVFIQADKTTARKFGGSGLGLAITRRLLELMNSQINLESAEGAGSTFSFKLIMPRSSAKLAKLATPATTGFKALNATILLVEDNIFNRAIAKDFLESWKCKVLEAGNGKEALDILESKEVDVVLLDLQMPVMDGFETISIIRSHSSESIKSLPVIALTAAALGDIENKVYQSGMDDFITKPFHPSDFYQKIITQINPVSNIQSESNVDSQIINKLQQTLGSGEQQIQKYFDVFIKTLKEESEVLNASIRGENLPALKAYAHKNKSSLALGGLENLSKEAEELEDMIDKNSVKSRVLEKALKHKKGVDKILSELKVL
ncbi:PAS domain S-box protein [Ekhidna sp.]|uniref:PAS domain S-box protein n=1 Tax=Ekhidna sp. TaxID=2608089 RepID=UPI003513D465